MIALFVIVFGLIVGSFLNVCIHRIPLNQSIVKPRSRCPSCGHQIRAIENVPVLSWLLLKGRCSQCKTSISIRYPLVELLTGLIFLSIYLKFGITLDFYVYTAFLCLVVIITFIDIDFQIIPNILLLIGLIPAVIPMLTGGLELVPRYLIGMVGFGGGFYLLGLVGKLVFKQEAMGMGDVKYAAVFGLLLGWQLALVATGVAFLSSAVLIIVLMPFRKIGFGQRLPFGPFLSFGVLAAVLAGDRIIHWYLGYMWI